LTYRIHRQTSETNVVFALSGDMDETHAAALQALIEREATKRVVLDLQEVTLVDRNAVRYLVRAAADGAILVNCPEYVRSWMAAERGQP
jgi:anti-anti-sigma regulatory factor